MPHHEQPEYVAARDYVEAEIAYKQRGVRIREIERVLTEERYALAAAATRVSEAKTRMAEAIHEAAFRGVGKEGGA